MPQVAQGLRHTIVIRCRRHRPPHLLQTWESEAQSAIDPCPRRRISRHDLSDKPSRTCRSWLAYPAFRRSGLTSSSSRSLPRRRSSSLGITRGCNTLDGNPSRVVSCCFADEKHMPEVPAPRRCRASRAMIRRVQEEVRLRGRIRTVDQPVPNGKSQESAPFVGLWSPVAGRAMLLTRPPTIP